MARELHDTVAHHVSAIAIQAQAGQLLASSRDLGGAAEALEVIEEEATRTLAEMRSIVGSLRQGNGTPQPFARGIVDIERLATAEGAAGLRIDVEHCGDLNDLRPSVQAALFRVAQESITNAKRHARHATKVHVLVAGGTETVRLSVSPARRPCMTIRVLIADDQGIIRAGLTTILNAQPGIEVVAQAVDGHEAVTLARRLRPDVCLFDIRMPRLDGVEATRRLAGPDIDDPLAVVVITTFDTDEHISGALKAGAKGFLLKDAGPDLLIQAIHAAAEGDALIAPSITARLLASFADTATSSERAQPLVALTDREEEVAVTVAQGRTNAEIANELHISLSTVKFHLASLMNKIGARNRVQIAIWAYETKRVRL